MNALRRTLAAFAVSAAAATSAAADPIRILALGDSLTAGYGLEMHQSFPSRLEAALKARGHDVVVINAGVSGDTAAAGLARLDWALGEGADAAIVELGANDMLRGVDPAETRKSIDAIVAQLTERKIPVLLAGMFAAPNLGEDYGRAFAAIFTDTAEKYGTLFYPFFLDGVVADPKLNQDDGMHPTAAGIDVIVGRILPEVEALIARAEAD